MSLSFEADLEITGGDSRIAVTADADGGLVITTDELRPLVGQLRSDGLLPKGSLRTVSDRLAGAGATVHLRTSSTGLVTLGSGAGAGLRTRLIGLHHVRVESFRGLLVALRPTVRPWTAVAAGAGVVAILVAGGRLRPSRGG